MYVRFRLIILAVLAVVVATSVAGKRSTVSESLDPSEIVLATVDDRPIMLSEFLTAFGALRTLPLDEDSLFEKKQEVASNLIFEEVLRIESDTVDLSADTAWIFRRDSQIRQFALSLMYQYEIVATTTVNDRVIEEFYESHPERYSVPEQVHARHILIKYDRATAAMDSTGDLEADAIARILEAKARVEAGEQFAEVAEEVTEDPGSRVSGGDLGAFGRGRMVGPFEDVAFSLSPGEISDTVRTTFGFHLIKVEEHTPSSPLPLDDSLRTVMSSTIGRELQREKADAYVESLRSGAVVRFVGEAATMPDSVLAQAKWTDTTIVAYVDEFAVTYRQFATEWMRKAPPAETDNGDRKREIVTAVAVFELLSRDAREKGYFDRPETIEQAENLDEQERVRRVRAGKPLGEQPADEEVAAYYEDNSERYRERRPLNVQHIVFVEEDSARAWAVHDSLLAGEDFRRMAMDHYPGDPEIRSVLFNLGWIGPGEMPTEFYDAAFALEKDSISDPVRTSYGWHIIHLVSRKDQPTFEQLEGRIRADMLKARNAEAESSWRESLIENHDVRVEEDVLRRAEAPSG
jgi:parvulin-like peptidyl-prolyl isomerase